MHRLFNKVGKLKLIAEAENKVQEMAHERITVKQKERRLTL